MCYKIHLCPTFVPEAHTTCETICVNNNRLECRLTFKSRLVSILTAWFCAVLQAPSIQARVPYATLPYPTPGLTAWFCAVLQAPSLQAGLIFRFKSSMCRPTS